MRENPFSFFSLILAHIFVDSSIFQHWITICIIIRLNWCLKFIEHVVQCTCTQSRRKKMVPWCRHLVTGTFTPYRQIHRWAASQWQSFDFVACWNDSVYMSLDLALQSAKLFPLNFDSNYSQVPSCHYTIYVPMGKE